MLIGNLSPAHSVAAGTLIIRIALSNKLWTLDHVLVVAIAPAGTDLTEAVHELDLKYAASGGPTLYYAGVYFGHWDVQEWAETRTRITLAGEVMSGRLVVPGYLTPAGPPTHTPADVARIPCGDIASGDRTRLKLEALALQGNVVTIAPDQARRVGARDRGRARACGRACLRARERKSACAR